LINPLRGLESIAPLYDVFLIDIIGVLHEDGPLFPKAVDAANHLLDRKKTVVFVSNTTKFQRNVKDDLKSKGLENEFPIVTSGDTVRALYAKDQPGSKCYHWGHPCQKSMPSILEIPHVPSLDQADWVLLTAFADDRGEENIYDPLMATIRQRSMPVWCVNPDLYAPYPQGRRRCAGFWAQRLCQKFGHENIRYIGKPYGDIYQKAKNFYRPEHQKKDVRTLVIGDTWHTDIAGAISEKFDSLWIHSCSIDLHETYPTYVCPALRW